MVDSKENYKFDLGVKGLNKLQTTTQASEPWCFGITLCSKVSSCPFSYFFLLHISIFFCLFFETGRFFYFHVKLCVGNWLAGGRN